MSGWCPAPVFPSSASGDLRRQGRRQDRDGSSEARSRSTSRGWTSWSSKQLRAGRLTFSTDLAAAVDGADAVFIAVGTPVAARRWPCRPELCLRRRRGDRRGAQAATPWSSPSRRCRSAPAAKLREDLREPAAGRRVRRRLQPRVPARGLGDRGLHAPGPGRIGTESERAREVHARRSTGRST